MNRNKFLVASLLLCMSFSARLTHAGFLSDLMNPRRPEVYITDDNRMELAPTPVPSALNKISESCFRVESGQNSELEPKDVSAILDVLSDCETGKSIMVEKREKIGEDYVGDQIADRITISSDELCSPIHKKTLANIVIGLGIQPADESKANLLLIALRKSDRELYGSLIEVLKTNGGLRASTKKSLDEVIKVEEAEEKRVLDEGQDQQAIEMIVGTEGYQYNSNKLLLLGIAYYKLGSISQSADTLSQAKALDPSSADINGWLNTATDQKKKNELAEEEQAKLEQKKETENEIIQAKQAKLEAAKEALAEKKRKAAVAAIGPRIRKLGEKCKYGDCCEYCKTINKYDLDDDVYGFAAMCPDCPDPGDIRTCGDLFRDCYLQGKK